MIAQPTVFVVEPDPFTCESIKRIAGLLDLRYEAYAVGQEFLDAFDRERPGCLVLEIRIPGVNGLLIQQKLVAMGATLPLIFLTASPSVSIAIHAMRMGALHFLEKPFREHDLWSAIQEAVQIDQERRTARSSQESMDTLAGELSEKECLVLGLLADCKSKQAMAEELGVSIRTIEHHRTKLMRKLKTKSIAGLLRFALTLKHSNPEFLEKALPSSPDGSGNGNGFSAGKEAFIPHNGCNAPRGPQGPPRRRNSK
jgi:FixJ family two-component response regulator